MFGCVLEEIIRGFQFRARHYSVSALSSFRAGQKFALFRTLVYYSVGLRFAVLIPNHFSIDYSTLRTHPVKSALVLSLADGLLLYDSG